MKWADQLIKLSNFELDILQRRVARAIERRVAAELKLAVLIAEGEAEIALARSDPEAAWKIAAFSEALKQRKAATQREIDVAASEEAGARDALTEAFETLKKYEQVADQARGRAARETARREGSVLDEMGMRRAASRR